MNKRNAKRLMYSGGLLIVLGNLLALITVFGIYDKAGQTLDGNSGVSLTTEELLVDISKIISLAGFVVLLVGISIYIIIRSKNK